MKVSKIVTLNSVELNQVMLDFASLVAQIEFLVKGNEVATPADLKNYINLLKSKPLSDNPSTYAIIDNINASTFVEVEH